MKQTEVSGMCQNRTEWNRIEQNVKKSTEGWWNKERNCLSVKGAFTQQHGCSSPWLKQSWMTYDSLSVSPWDVENVSTAFFAASSSEIAADSSSSIVWRPGPVEIFRFRDGIAARPAEGAEGGSSDVSSRESNRCNLRDMMWCILGNPSSLWTVIFKTV